VRAVHIRVCAAKNPETGIVIEAAEGAAEKPMDEILQFMQDWAFDPDAVQAVMLAFIMACHELNATETSSVIKSMIARRIIAHAQRGERSPERLCRRTVDEVLPKRRHA
jgi:hypothetical protein